MQIYSQYVKVTVDAAVFNPHDEVQLADFNLRLPDQAFISYFHMWVFILMIKLATVYYKLFKVEKFHGFRRLIINRKTFTVKCLCNRLWACKTTVQPWMFSSELQFTFATVKQLHLKRFAVVI